MQPGEAVTLYLHNLKKLLQETLPELAENVHQPLLLQLFCQDCQMIKSTVTCVWGYKEVEYSSSAGQNVDGCHGTRTNCNVD